MEQIQRQAKWTTNGRSSSKEGDIVCTVDWKGILYYNSCKIKWLIPSTTPDWTKWKQHSTKSVQMRHLSGKKMLCKHHHCLFPNFFITSNSKSVTIKQSFPIPSSSQALVTYNLFSVCMSLLILDITYE